MKIRRYFGTDTRKTMRQIRMEQGPDAVILSCRSIGGQTEIVTAIENELPASSLEKGRPTNAERPDAGVGYSTQPNELEAIRRELRAMHGMMQDRFSRLVDIDAHRRNPIQAGLIERLQEKGFESSLSRSLVAGLRYEDSQRSWHQVLVRLAGRLKVTDDDILKRGGQVAMLGVSGAGKTSIVAKLAARYRLRHGHNQVALVSSDVNRIGSTQQLERYASLLQVPLRMVRNSNQLQRALAEFADFSLVLIDTPGLGQRHPGLEPQLEMLARIQGLRSYLVIPANVYASVLEQSLSRYAQFGLSGAILTKIDESESLGETLSPIITHGLPLAYVSDGKEIPGDLRPARSARMVALALTIGDRRPTGTAEVAQSA